MAIGVYFDIKRDNQLIANGSHFWCTTCLMARPLDDLSPDPRYCQGCYDFLLKEVEMLNSGKRLQWISRVPPEPIGKAVQSKSGGGHNYIDTLMGSPMRSGIMQTIKGKKSEVCIIPPSVNSRPIVRRGPKHKTLPVELIIQWSNEGMRLKAIAAKLEAKQDIKVHYSTISRILAGQRVLI